MSKTKYIQYDPITHILKRPEMYVGSKTFEKKNVYVLQNQNLIKKEINVSNALIRTFIEILSNAIDNFERNSKKMTYIKVNLTNTSCEIENDGESIPVEKNDEGKYWYSLIFGELLTGSNYDDEEKRFTSGRNGLGAKLTNVLSTIFQVTGLDTEKNIKFSQTWKNNMRTVEKPKLTKNSNKKSFTKIYWEWDLDWFGIENIHQDILDYFGFFIFNTAMITGLKVSLNGEKLPNKLNTYFSYFSNNFSTDICHFETQTYQVHITPFTEFEFISFVNGIYTSQGGKHVTAITNAICKNILSKITKSEKITIKDVKNFFRFLIVVKIPNPEFNNQEKDLLTSNFKCENIPEKIINKILKWDIIEEIKKLNLKKQEKSVIKQVVNKKHPIIKDYDKANNYGNLETSLILCEGLSAKTFAVEGIEKGMFGKKGRDWFGIYPLRGKFLNTRNCSLSIISKNTIILNLIKILGLDFSNRSNFKNLNYGRIVIITDADVDGIHIEGLILNFFHSLFPKIIEKNMIFSMKTPLFKIQNNFFFQKPEKLDGPKNHPKIKYLKGLGSIPRTDVKKIFGEKIIHYENQDDTSNFFKLAFDKDKTEERKKWLTTFQEESITNSESNSELIDIKSSTKFSENNLNYFLNKNLINFFLEDCLRNLPSVIDGLKESQRKILFASKKKNFSSELKVAQFGSFVAECTDYKYGEGNLFKTIIKMAQRFPGSNNLPLFTEGGMFGSRLEGGEDYASPRYIFTKPEKYLFEIFPEADDQLLKYKKEDEQDIEPIFFVPIIPLLLVNGCLGIGTGWMCNVPCFKLEDVIEICHAWFFPEKRKNFEDLVSQLKPHYNGFKGEIKKIDETKFSTHGIYQPAAGPKGHKQKSNKTIVTELPIGMSISKFHQFLEEKEINFKNNSSSNEIYYEFVHEEELNLEKKLTTYLNLDNIVILDKNNQILKINLIDIFDYWGSIRSEFYILRKENEIKILQEIIYWLKCQLSFISHVKNKNLDLTDKKNIIENFIKLNITTQKDIIQKLIHLPIVDITLEKKNILSEKIKKKEKNLEIWKTETVFSLWKKDINLLLK